MNPYNFEESIIRTDLQTLPGFLMEHNLLVKEMICEICNHQMTIKACKDVKECVVWRCTNAECSSCRQRISIRKNSFFSNFNLDMKKILRVLIKWTTNQQAHSIAVSLNMSSKMVSKIINYFIESYLIMDIDPIKLGGHGSIVQIDETMLNYKCKSHRGRSPGNKTDALCIVEYRDKISRVYATVIPDKKASTIIPIICEHVVLGSIIYTDEHKSYTKLSENGFVHGTVCHKYNFVDPESGVHTQAVESFNNCLKTEIKEKGGKD